MAAAQHTESDLQDSIPDSPSSSAITTEVRVAWIVKGTLGPRSLAIGIFTAGIQTAQNRPREYGPHWEGFGKRYGIRLTGVATERVMEASLGALWGEDPRYFPAEDRALQIRMKNIVLMTVATRRADGNFRLCPLHCDARQQFSLEHLARRQYCEFEGCTRSNSLGIRRKIGRECICRVLARCEKAPTPKEGSTRSALTRLHSSVASRSSRWLTGSRVYTSCARRRSQFPLASSQASND